MSRNNIVAAGVFLLMGFSILSCDQSKYGHGKRLYTSYCQSCHMQNGEGLASLIPALDSDYYRSNRDQLACIIKNGLAGKITVNGKVYDQVMPANKQLSTTDITNIINYIDNELLKEERFTAVAETKTQLENCDQ